MELGSELFLGKRYIVTGASAGIGVGFVKTLHAHGAYVILVARREERLQALVSELNEKRANSAEYKRIDLGDAESLKELVAFIESEQIDGLINNAGFGSVGNFQKLEIENECRMLRVNVEAPLRLTHAVIPQMMERKSGVIVHLASIAAFQPLPYMATYAATKAMNLFCSLAHRQELAQHGIRVVAVCPGPIPTEFGEVAKMPGGAFSESAGDTVQDVVSSTLRGIERNASFVVPGKIGKTLNFFTRITPRWFNMWLAGRILRATVEGNAHR